MTPPDLLLKQNLMAELSDSDYLDHWELVVLLLSKVLKNDLAPLESFQISGRIHYSGHIIPVPFPLARLTSLAL